MKKFIFSVITICVSTASNASLTPPVLSGSASSIDAVQSVTFSTYFTDTLTAGFDSEYIKSVSYVFNSVDGQTSSNSFATNSQGGIAPTVNLSQSFTYATPGTYQPSFSAKVTTFDNYSVTHPNFIGLGYSYSYPSNCGPTSNCAAYGYSYPIFGEDKTEYYSTELNFDVSSATSLTVATPVPESETYTMMLAGVVLIGGVARRRKQKAVAA